MMTMLPSFFVAHGAPTLAIENNAYTDFLGQFAMDFSSGYGKPEAIVLFSAHWESRTQLVSSVEQYEMIYDFGGFPDELYQIQYPAKGSPELADRIVQLLSREGISNELDTKRGLDHGTWVPLRLLFPAADIPVVQMSVNPLLVAEESYRIGKAIAPLREQNILVLGSGGTVHNLRRVDWRAQAPDPWAISFDQWLIEQLEVWDTEALYAYMERAPYAKEAVPRNEHFIPLLYAAGAADLRATGSALNAAPRAKLLFRDYQYGSLSLSFWQFDT
jgi:4,5-DOPA dioxygenase extradiol